MTIVGGQKSLKIEKAARPMIKRFLQKLPLFLVLIVIALSLSGCFKVRVAVDVKPNGSGTVGISMGMTSQAKALIASQGEGDPIQSLAKDISENPNNPSDVKITRWTEGDYEWVQGEVAFNDLNDLNKRMSGIDYFEYFSITRKPGLFRDSFVLNARLKPLLDGTDTSSGIDPSAFIEMQMMIHLPGDVIETNGVFDGKDSTNMIWTVNSKQAVTMQATSETWNWLNIGIFAALGVLGVLAVSLVAIFMVSEKPKKKVVPAIARHNVGQLPKPNSNTGIVTAKNNLQPISASDDLLIPETRTTSTPNWLVAIGARSLLNDVNHFMLKDVGVIYESEDEIYLEWFSISGKNDTQGIHITLISQQEIKVNEKLFPATHEGLKLGIATCLREMNKPRTR